MQDTSRATPDTEARKIAAAVPSKLQTVDQELLYEEQLGKVMADNENIKNEKRELQKDLQELHDRLVRLQTNNVESYYRSRRTGLIKCRIYYKKG